MNRVGTVVGLWRYPVKSMLGEQVAVAEVGDKGLIGDRGYALLDTRTGRVLSAKNPKRWPGMFRLRASYVSPPLPGRPLPPVRIEFPDGRIVESTETGAAGQISSFLGGDVRLVTGTETRSAVEVYTPPIPGLREGFTEFRVPPGPFHDSTPIHLVTEATLARLGALYPQGRFLASRFRPNFLVETGGPPAFVEQGWIGGTLALGSARVRIVKPCSRCVMTTLPQGDLPEDRGILQTVVSEADGDVGVKGPVTKAGIVRRGDPVVLE